MKDKPIEKSISGSGVIEFYTRMENLGIKIWIDGGWSVAALLGRQLRPHKDLDIAVQWKDVPKLREDLANQGYKQIKEDSQWNFVLADDKGHEIDVHAFIYDDKGNVVEGIMYPAESLTGAGTIDGKTVRCISPKYMVEFLAPYIHKWPEKYLEAVSALCEKYGLESPKEYKNLEQSINIEGLNIKYLEVGNKQNPLLLFVHGWPMSLVTFKTIGPFVFINELAKHFYVVIPQLPGFFNSEPPKDLWGVENYANFVHQFIQKLDLNKPIVMGKSFGGGVVAMLAYKYPGDVSKLVLIDSAALPERTKLFWFQAVKPFAVFGR